MLKAILILCLLILFPVLGGGIVISSIAMLGKATAARDWPTVPGKILSSEVIAELRSNFGSSGDSTRKPTEVYSAQVRYEYVVGGEKFRGERISFENGPSTDRYQAELTAKKFNTGATTVFYNPVDPQDALLSPQENGSIILGLVFGVILMIVPTGLILVGLRYQFISKPKLPTHIQLWWDLKFGKYRSHGIDQLRIQSPIEPNLLTDEAPSAKDPAPAEFNAPVEENFIETIVTWNPKSRIELSSYPEAIWMYLLVSAVVGLILAWVGMFPVTHFIFRRDTPHLSELGSVFGMLLLTTSSLVFFVSRYWDRGSQTVIDWQSGLIRSKREFSFSRQYNIRDVQSVLVRCVPVEGRHRKFRASVELDVVGEFVTAARTCEPRRKPESAREKALNLAEPLADALGVQVELAGWDSK